MRPRIKKEEKVDVNAIINKLEYKRKVYSSAIKELMADGFSYSDAKKWVNGVREGFETDVAKQRMSNELWDKIKLEIKRQKV